MSKLRSKFSIYFWYILSQSIYTICLWAVVLCAWPFILVGKIAEPWANNWKFRLEIWKDLKRKEDDLQKTTKA